MGTMGVKHSKRSVEISSTPKKGEPELKNKEEKVAEVTEEKPVNGEVIVTENGDAKTETNGDVVKEDVIKEEPIKEVAEDEGDKEKGDGDSKETEEGVEKSDDSKVEEKKKESKTTNLRKK